MAKTSTVQRHCKQSLAAVCRYDYIMPAELAAILMITLRRW